MEDAQKKHVTAGNNVGCPLLHHYKIEGVPREGSPVFARPRKLFTLFQAFVSLSICEVKTGI